VPDAEPSFFHNTDDARAHSQACVTAGAETVVIYLPPDPAENAETAAVSFRLGGGHLVETQAVVSRVRDP